MLNFFQLLLDFFLDFPALPFIRNNLSRVLLTSSFQVGSVNGRYWQTGGQDGYLSASPLQLEGWCLALFPSFCSSSRWIIYPSLVPAPTQPPLLWFQSPWITPALELWSHHLLPVVLSPRGDSSSCWFWYLSCLIISLVWLLSNSITCVNNSLN